MNRKSWAVVAATICIAIASVVTSASAATLFSDDFESDTLDLWTVATSTKWKTKGGTGHAGTYKAEVKGNTSGDDSLTVATSTADHENITLNYWFQIDANLESDDHVYVEWSTDGTSWTQLADYTATSSGPWLYATHNLGSGADDQSGFQMRYRANLGAGSDVFWLDDVGLSGDTIQQTATLTVTKIVENDDGGTATTTDFKLYVHSVEVTSGNATTVSPGTYTITEDQVSGYTVSFSADCSGGSITLALGETKTCTITNADNGEAPSSTFDNHYKNFVITTTPASLALTGSSTDNYSGIASSTLTIRQVGSAADVDNYPSQSFYTTFNAIDCSAQPAATSTQSASLTLTSTTSLAAMWSYTWTATTSDDGIYCFEVRAEDNTGNVESTAYAGPVAYVPAPVISSETASGSTDTGFTVTWTTDYEATSRVIYDTVSHASLGDAPNYGYAFSTTETDTSPKVTAHSVVLSGLSAGTTYYYRTISRGSPESVSAEGSIATSQSSSASGGGGGSVSGGHSNGPIFGTFGVIPAPVAQTIQQQNDTAATQPPQPPPAPLPLTTQKYVATQKQPTENSVQDIQSEPQNQATETPLSAPRAVAEENQKTFLANVLAALSFTDNAWLNYLIWLGLFVLATAGLSRLWRRA